VLERLLAVRNLRSYAISEFSGHGAAGSQIRLRPCT
jgi:hypothetical protein